MDRADMNALVRAIMTLYVLLFFSPVLAQTSALTTTERVAGCWERDFGEAPPKSKGGKTYLKLCFFPKDVVTITFFGGGDGSFDGAEWTTEGSDNINIGNYYCRISFSGDNIVELAQCGLAGIYRLKCRDLESLEDGCK